MHTLTEEGTTEEAKVKFVYIYNLSGGQVNVSSFLD